MKVLIISTTGAFSMPIGVSDNDISNHDLILAEGDSGAFYIFADRIGEFVEVVDKRSQKLTTVHKAKQPERLTYPEVAAWLERDAQSWAGRSDEWAQAVRRALLVAAKELRTGEYEDGRGPESPTDCEPTLKDRCPECNCYDGTHMILCQRGERIAVVKWLRSGKAVTYGQETADVLADKIERGEHTGITGKEL